MKGNFK